MLVQIFYKRLIHWITVGCLVFFLTPVQAHLMAAQKGTLNIVDDAAFLVLSVPVSALHGVDDDADGKMSKQELEAHMKSVQEQIKAGLKMSGPKAIFELQLMMVDRATTESNPHQASDQLVVLGRFQLNTFAATNKYFESYWSEPVLLSYALFGAKKNEQVLDLIITRKAESQWLHLTPLNSSKELLPSHFSIFKEYALTGAQHVLTGADHLLFLLIVLTAGLSWRSLLAVLSCFTAGHALSVSVCVLAGWTIPSQIIEPAIAATIVGLAAFDIYLSWRKKTMSTYIRIGLVFICAIIHGFGLAGALKELAQWPLGSEKMIGAMVSFNIGIELVQLVLASLACFLFYLLTQQLKWLEQQKIIHFGSFLGIVLGGLWLFERVAL
jgi:hypothetical protein